jgi:hypothetical protein
MTTENRNTENRTRRQVSVGSLIVDQTVGPDVDPNGRHVRKLREQYDRQKVGVFTVSERADGALVLLDGYRRRWAVLQQEGADALVDCAVYTGLGREPERFMRSRVNGFGYPRNDERDRELRWQPVLISDDADLDDRGYSLKRVLCLPDGRVLRIRVYRPIGAYFGTSSATATADLLDADGRWDRLTDYASLSWMPTTPHPPTENTEDTAAEGGTDNHAGIGGAPSLAAVERMTRFIRDTLTPVVDELQRRATAMLAATPQTGQNTPATE